MILVCVRRKLPYYLYSVTFGTTTTVSEVIQTNANVNFNSGINFWKHNRKKKQWKQIKIQCIIYIFRFSSLLLLLLLVNFNFVVHFHFFHVFQCLAVDFFFFCFCYFNSFIGFSYKYFCLILSFIVVLFIQNQRAENQCLHFIYVPSFSHKTQNVAYGFFVFKYSVTLLSSRCSRHCRHRHHDHRVQTGFKTYLFIQVFCFRLKLLNWTWILFIWLAW